jgi:phosphoesterase RecJ-like protein
MDDLGGTNDDLEGLINFPLTVKDIAAVAFFKEIADQDWRVSLRSKGAVDVGAIARWLGGGGHTNASGCSVTGSLDTVQKQFAESLAEAIRNK